MDDFMMSYSVEEYYDDEIAEYLYNRTRSNMPRKTRIKYESSYNYDDVDNIDNDDLDYYKNV